MLTRSKLCFAARGCNRRWSRGRAGIRSCMRRPGMPCDFKVMADISRGGAIPDDLVRATAVSTLVVAGGASPDFFRDADARITALLPNGKHTVRQGQDHGAPADVVAPVAAEFLTVSSPEARSTPGLSGLWRTPPTGEPVANSGPKRRPHPRSRASRRASLVGVDVSA